MLHNKNQKQFDSSFVYKLFCFKIERFLLSVSVGKKSNLMQVYFPGGQYSLIICRNLKTDVHRLHQQVSYCTYINTLTGEKMLASARQSSHLQWRSAPVPTWHVFKEEITTSQLKLLNCFSKCAGNAVEEICFKQA